MVNLPARVATRDRMAALLDKIDGRFRRTSTRERCQQSLRYFVEHAWPHIDPSPFMANWAIDAVCDHLEAVMLGEIPNLLINIPPRCSKTTIVSIMFPAWVNPKDAFGVKKVAMSAIPWRTKTTSVT
jgi:hypothetical protein